MPHLTFDRIEYYRAVGALMKTLPHILHGHLRLQEYLSQYAKCVSGRPWVWEVHTPLPVFKHARHQHRPDTRFSTPVIVNLLIPKGETFVWCVGPGNPSQKMRASAATVHSLFNIELRYPEPIVTAVDSAVASYDQSFFYHKGETVRPTRTFDAHRRVCSIGIHFYVNLRTAVRAAF